MNNNIQICQINFKDTVPLRLEYLRTGKTELDCHWDNDEHIKSIHLGAYIGNKIVGVLSAVPESHPEILEDNQFRVRGLVVDKKYRNQRIPILLYSEMNKLLKKNGASVLWAFVRPTAYHIAIKVGAKQVGHPFVLNNLGEHLLFMIRCR